MTDYFALLNEPRRPWLDPAALKAKFVALTAEVHPDRVYSATEAEKMAATRRYAELNTAYHCLQEPRERLLHLLELERGSRPEEVQRIDPAITTLFMEIIQLCREADAFLEERARTSSPILKVKLFERGTRLSERLNTLLQKLQVKRDALVVQLKDLNLAWESAPSVGSPTRIHVLPCSRLEHIYRDFSYLTRGSQQIQERVVQLSF
ncbi:MAG: hypothetical protein DME19_05225 [Verrucomicrobia bacterium]|nr:MAG: hypothetical protein DME19_05225 [Verrucomicrobiota bacterium]